jgi:membrane-associated phospholipid phosphatase
MDLSISYPEVQESITTGTLIGVSLIAPAVIIFLVVAAFVPGPQGSRELKRSTLIKRKLWEWEQGWAGLALSLAIAFFVTQGMKNIFGKPRPSCIARCQPDVNNFAQYVVGSVYGQNLDPRWTLVSAGICRNPDTHIVDDAFKSFPSGHASFSWSGLLYLSFFLCSKFAIGIPYLPTQPSAHNESNSHMEVHEMLPLHNDRQNSDDPNRASNSSKQRLRPDTSGEEFAKTLPVRNLAASPPNHLIILAFIPVAVAIYICSTRFVQFYHFGFDLISGALIGILSSWFSFRWYHTPISRGAGWAWGPRSMNRAFGIGVGVGNYVGAEGWGNGKNGRNANMNGPV